MDGGDVVRVLITGATGTLGGALCSAGRRFGHDMLGVSRTKPPGFKECEWRPLDVRDGESVDRLIAEVRPDLVINSAAVVGDWTVTAGGAVNVAVACAERGVRQLLMSTDAVFVSRDEGYREEEPPSPVTPYGAAKAAAAPVRAGGPRPRLRYELGSAAHPSSLPRVWQEVEACYPQDCEHVLHMKP